MVEQAIKLEDQRQAEKEQMQEMQAQVALMTGGNTEDGTYEAKS